MKKFKECIIHIGTEKTGTTTLQLFFQKNRINLAKNGILFPKTLGEPNHTYLSAYARDVHEIGGLRIRLGLTSEKLVYDFRNKLEMAFRQEIENSNLSKLLISNEHLHSGLQSVEEVQRVKNFLDEFVDTYKIVVYIRPQHEMAVSHFSTRCKNLATDKTFFEQKFIDNLYYNFEELLNRWETVFGFDNITVKIFSKDELLDGDIKKDFCSIFGWDWNEFENIENFNEGINAEAQLFLLEINKFIPLFNDIKPNPIRGNLSGLISSGNEGKGLLPSHKDTEVFVKMFEESNERVRKKWFPERNVLFKTDLSKFPKEPNYKTDYKFAFKIFAKVWELKQNQLFAEQEEIRKLEELIHKIEKDKI